MTIATKGYAVPTAGASFESFPVERRAIGPADVHINIKYCGVCHSDLHQVKDHWTGGIFPMVPGHEMVGNVVAVGSEVKKLKVGDFAGVGCFVESCRNCMNCKEDQEQHCKKVVVSYNGLDHNGKPTYGGYSKDIVVTERFVCKIPESLSKNLAETAPLLCAGITTWTPMKRHHMDAPGKKIGVIGLGGLGHMAVQFGIAFGNEVTVISTSESKREEAMKKFGVKRFVVSKDKKQMTEAEGSLDFIIDTVSAEKDMSAYIKLLRREGIIVSVAAPPATYRFSIAPTELISQSTGIFGSLVGGMKATQDMLDFCGEKNIVAKVEVIKMKEIEKAFDRMLKSDIRYRFVIDVENSDF